MLPSNMNYIDTLVESYNNDVDGVNKLISFLDETPKNIKDYVFTTNRYEPYKGLKDVLINLKSKYWIEVYNRSNFADIISSKARDEIQKTFSEDKENLPDFNETNIKSTLESWAMSSGQMFSEKVDTIFQKLSGEHVTNRPHGFSKKMIFKHMVDYSWSESIFSKYMFTERAVSIIHDLRTAIQTIYKAPISDRYDTTITLKTINERNEFTEFDNGAFKIKIFKNGNAHIELDPHVAIMLNCELAKLYPNAIPSKHRIVTKEIKEYNFDYEHLSTSKKENLRNFVMYCRKLKVEEGYNYSFPNPRNFISDDVHEVLEFLGVECIEKHHLYFSEFDITEPLRHIITNGIVDIKSNQFYPTPKEIVEDIVEFVGDYDNEELKILEPSAGMGNIAKYFNTSLCIEKEPLNCIILKERGLNVLYSDFLKYNDSKFDLIVMNPPYNNRQWKTHVEHAISLLEENGEIYAVLPIGKESEFENCIMMKKYENVFDDTTITTALYKIEK